MAEGGLFEPIGALIRKVDAQGRIVLPGPVTADVGTTVVVSPGLAGCIEIHRPRDWQKYEAKFANANPRDPDVARLYRHLIAPAEPITVDGQGRLRFPEALLRHAGLVGDEREAQILRMPDWWEVWDTRRFAAIADAERPALEEIARRVLGGS